MLLIGPLLLEGCGRLEARHPNWEPTSERVPQVSQRELALTRLNVSRLLWAQAKEGDQGAYVYVRANQVSRELVRFTMIGVEADSVRLRVLMEGRLADVDAWPDRMELRHASLAKRPPFPTVVWHERDASIASHADGAPAYSIDELYDLCEKRVLGTHPDLPVRLCFHRQNGVLAHCGFVATDCPSCLAVSIQSVARRPPVPKLSPVSPERYMCWDASGLWVAEDTTAMPAHRCRLCLGCGDAGHELGLVPQCCRWGAPAMWNDESFEDRGGYFDRHIRRTPPNVQARSDYDCDETPASGLVERLPH